MATPPQKRRPKKKSAAKRPPRNNGTSKKAASRKTPPKKAAKKEKKQLEMVMVPLEHVFPEGQEAIFANALVVQHDGPEFHLLFFQTHPPLRLGDDSLERLKELESVKTRCVARVVVSSSRVPGIIDALSENFSKFAEKQSLLAETEKKVESDATDRS